MLRSSLFLLVGLSIHSGVALADLKKDHDRAILSAAISETGLTQHEKLFVYRCEMIEKYVGFSGTPTGRAIKHSCDKPEIGIAFYAGKDLGQHSPEKVAKYFRQELAKYRIKSEVFIDPDHQYGSSMAFYVNGDSWLKNAVDPLKGIEMIEALASEALLILYTKGRIDKWPEGVPRID